MSPDQQLILPVELPPMPRQLKIRNLKKPIWTQNKTRLIQRYVYYFLLVTHNCTYIDGFAGPQKEGKEEMWSAKLVLELRPRWVKNFYLFEKSRSQVKRLRRLAANQPPRAPGDPKRKIRVMPGDVNVELPAFLEEKPITEKEATFCLLDQRTFECHWSTVRAVSQYKSGGMKIEIFYLFPIGWLDRSLQALKNDSIGDAWWGRSDWRSLRSLGSIARGQVIAQRFSAELGYRHVNPFPIYERPGGGRIMYFMVHASDHDEAPKLMWRAYHKAIEPLEPEAQIQTEFAGFRDRSRESLATAQHG